MLSANPEAGLFLAAFKRVKVRVKNTLSAMANNRSFSRQRVSAQLKVGSNFACPEGQIVVGASRRRAAPGNQSVAFLVVRHVRQVSTRSFSLWLGLLNTKTNTSAEINGSFVEAPAGLCFTKSQPNPSFKRTPDGAA